MGGKGPVELFAVAVLPAYFDGALVGDGELEGPPTGYAVLVVQLGLVNVVRKKA